MKKRSAIFLVIAVLIIAASISSGQRLPFETETLSPDSVTDVSGQKTPMLVTAEAQRRDVADFDVISVIVTFESPVNPSDLAAATNGKVIHRYRRIFNGASLVLSPDKMEALDSIPGITGIYLDEVNHLNTDASPEFIGAPEFWDALGGQENAGEGIVVGVLDSGIWPEHPSFSDPDPSGNSYPAPPGGPYDCNFGNTAWNPDDAPFACNNKLIGAYEFMDTYKAVRGLDSGEFDSARDSDGHGSHTSATAAGNTGVQASIFGTPLGIVSGIAPRAHIIMYRVCGGPRSACFSSDSAAAVEQAILDGVDVINFSVGGGVEPYSDAVSLAFLSAYENGVFVACSAGNSGPGADTVGHREPWTMTTAASTQARSFEGHLNLMADNGDTLDLTGVSIGGTVTGEIVLGADYGNALCGSVSGYNPFPPGTFTSDQIVVCQRGATARVEKSANVLESGGGGMVLYNSTVHTLSADNHFVPTVHIDDVSGGVLLDFLSTHTGVTASLEGGFLEFGRGDVMAAFSSRGGPEQTLGISKPDISAPGVNILAAQTPMPAFPKDGGGYPGEYFQALGGTSMSSPHIAGAAALLKRLHPDWTPGMIKSALMTTAFADDLLKEDEITPANAFDYGSGRVDLTKAGNPGLTISAATNDFIGHELDLWNVNYPSLYLPALVGKLSVQRTIHSVLGKNGPWKFSVDGPPDLRVNVPTALNVKAGQDASFDISVDASEVPLDEARLATLYLTQKDMVARFPITVVRREPVVTLEKTCSTASLSYGETTDCTITIANTSYDEAAVSLYDHMPPGLPMIPGSAVGAAQTGAASLSFDGTLYAASPPSVTVVDGTGTTPAGYLPLSLFGIAPLTGVGDETIVNFSVYPFVYAGQTWTSIGMVSNGYAVVGGGTGDDVQYINQNLPDPAQPNNVLAPFWTDLNPATGGDLRAGYLSDGVNTWLVLDWENVPNYGTAGTNSFQIWIRVDGVEDISFTYGTVTSGDGGYLTVGAENEYGNSGQNWYYDGAGTPVAPGSEVRVTSEPGAPGETHVITYTVRGEGTGPWTNCAEMTSNLFQGMSTACFDGETVP